MTIIFGAGQLGKEVYEAFFEHEIDVVFYDNDRRKWGSEYCSRQIINLDQYLDLLKSQKTTVVLASSWLTAPYFLKDTIHEQNIVLKYTDGKLEKYDITALHEWTIDRKAIEKKRLDEYKRLADDYLLRGKKKAYDHAMAYISFKKKNLETPQLVGVELTNFCNLKCKNCPNAMLRREKGFMSEEIFLKAMKYATPGGVMTFHGMGEPLLHKNLIKNMTYANELGISTFISTNGILLNKEMIEEIFFILNDMKEGILYVSLHTQKSLESWIDCLRYADKYPRVTFRGQLLEHNKKQVLQWMEERGTSNGEHHPNIHHVSVHSFAGNVQSKKKAYNKVEIRNRIRGCCFLRNNQAQVRWDGSLSNCCLDVNEEATCGSIDRFEEARSSIEGYALCNRCDPDVFSHYQ